VPNFTPISATCRPCGAKNLKNRPLSKLNTGRFALRAMLPVTIMACPIPSGGHKKKKITTAAKYNGLRITMGSHNQDAV